VASGFQVPVCGVEMDLSAFRARVSTIVGLGLGMDADQRERLIERETEGDPELRAAVRKAINVRLLDGMITGGGFEVDDTRSEPQPPALSRISIGDRLGAWRIVSVLGRGGMGEVYEARRDDGLYDQRAALKIIDGALDQARAAELFQSERQLLARLEHPGIARLLDGGTGPDGRGYMVMEYVEGEPLVARSATASLKDRLVSFLSLLDAVSHAHSRLVVHRDIKPSNVLLMRTGQIKLLDFGVASLSVKQAASAGSAPFTPDYAAPELKAGEPAAVTSDVYGAGTVLYELLTGRRYGEDRPSLPGLGKAVQGLASQVTRSVPARALRGDLDAILTKALRSDPTERYRTIDGFAADIRCFLDHQPVGARNGGSAYRFSRFMRRYRWPVAATLGVTLTLMAGLGGTIWQANTAQRERDIALREEARLRAMQQATFVMFSEAGDGSGMRTADDLIERSAERVLKEFEADPAAAAPVLHMFGEIYFLLNNYTAAETLLSALVLSEDPDIAPDLRAMASHDLATVLFRQGKGEQARPLYEQAAAYWNTQPERYQDEILAGFILEAQLLNSEGFNDAAIALLQSALPRRLSLSGSANMDTASLYNSLGAAYYRAGRTEDALSAFSAARDGFIALERLDSPDGLNVTNNLASLFHVSGQYEQALEAYQQTAQTRRQLYGPSAALSVVLMNQAKLHVEMGNPAASLRLYDEAVPMALEYAGALSGPGIASRAGRVEAMIANGDRAPALVAALALDAEVAQSDAGDTILGGLSAMALARAYHADGQLGRAKTSAARALDLFEKAGPGGVRARDSTLDLLEKIEGG